MGEGRREYVNKLLLIKSLHNFKGVAGADGTAETCGRHLTRGPGFRRWLRATKGAVVIGEISNVCSVIVSSGTSSCPTLPLLRILLIALGGGVKQSR
jgi:hypothetical protein